MEQVCGFNDKRQHGLFTDVSPLEVAIEELKSLTDEKGDLQYPGIAVCPLCPSIWTDVTRPRCPHQISDAMINDRPPQFAVVLSFVVEY